MFGGLITIAGGIRAASGFIIKRSPNAQSLIVKIAPYRGGIGMLMFVWGEWETYAQRPRHLAARLAPISCAFRMAWGVAGLLVNFLLGFGLLTHSPS